MLKGDTPAKTVGYEVKLAYNKTAVVEISAASVEITVMLILAVETLANACTGLSA
jgi:hypothetical protein